MRRGAPPAASRQIPRALDPHSTCSAWTAPAIEEAFFVLYCGAGFLEPRIRFVTSPDHQTTQRFRVLIVEDDPDVGDVETLILGYAGYDVFLVRNGREALDTLRRQRFNVVVLDLMMPGMDGLTFLAERHRLRIGEGIPILCVSAAATDMLTQALRLGACACVQKPTDFEQLCDMVEHYCTAT